ncbi:MAG: hypothetical protein ABWX67_04265 [Allosphingosinicella sp.]
MAAVDNVKLEIAENQGAAAALVTYRLKGTPQEVLEDEIFIEAVELIGVDKIAGEDGQNEVIPGVRFERSVTIPSLFAFRSRLLAMQANVLNEDSNPGPFDVRVDEIQARVTLSRNSRVLSTASSDPVRRGGINFRPPVIPA